jgi:general secretion pathway protein A
VYEQYFGLRERPFELTTDPRYLVLSSSHKEALSNLSYGVATRKGVTVIVGEVGSGKTTLVRRTLATTDARTRCVLLMDPHVTPEDFMLFLVRELGLPDLEAAPRWRRRQELERHLAQRWDAGDATALIIDEAQSLSDAMFEELRLLTNLETDTAKLLPLLLVGQPELADRLNQPALRYLKQRVALRCVLRPLDLQETATYIAARIAVAGGVGSQIFTREAVTAIYQASQGLPRAISVLCDNALLTAFAAGRKPVSAQIIADVCKDFDCHAVPGTFETSASAETHPATEADGSSEAVSPNRVPGQPVVPEQMEHAEGERELFGGIQRPRRFSLFGATGR